MFVCIYYSNHEARKPTNKVIKHISLLRSSQFYSSASILVGIVVTLSPTPKGGVCPGDICPVRQTLSGMAIVCFYFITLFCDHVICKALDTACSVT